MATKAQDVEGKFQLWRDVIISELVHAGASFEIVRGIQRFGVKHPEILSFSPGFWEYTWFSNFHLTLLRLWKIAVDSRNEVASLPNIIKFIDSHKQTFTEAAIRARMKARGTTEEDIDFELRHSSYVPIEQGLLDVQSSLQKIKPTLTAIGAWRNRVIGHRNLSDALEERDIGSNYPLKVADLEKVMDICGNSINLLSSGFDMIHTQLGGKETMHQHDIRQSLEFVLNAVNAATGADGK